LATQQSDFKEGYKDPFTEMMDDPTGPWAGKLEVKSEGFNADEVKFLVYGESGVGKTVFASTWPKPVFLDIDKGMASVRREVHRFPISTWEDLTEAVDLIANYEHPFRTVVVDSLNELQKLTMRNIVSTYTSIRRAYDNLPSLSDYGKMLDDYDKMVRFIRALPMNVVFVAQVAAREYETDPVQPQLTGKQSARDLCRMMDVVGYLDKADSEGGGAKTRIMTFDAVNFVTKDRSGVLPGRVDNPSHEVLLKNWTKQS